MCVYMCVHQVAFNKHTHYTIKINSNFSASMQQLNLTNIFKQAKGGSTAAPIPTFTPGHLPEGMRNRGAFFWDGGESNESDGALGKKSAVKTGAIALKLFTSPTAQLDQAKKEPKGKQSAKTTPISINLSKGSAQKAIQKQQCVKEKQVFVQASFLKESVGSKRPIDEILQEQSPNKRIKVDDALAPQSQVEAEVKTQDTEMSQEISSQPEKEHRNKKPNGFSQSTQAILQSLLSPKLKSQVLSARSPQLKQFSPSTMDVLQLLSSEEAISRKPKIQENLLEKHSQLLNERTELVLPIHYKKLLDIQKYLDSSLNFIRQSRRQASTNFIDIKSSIERSYGKQFDIEAFKQILFLAPDYYDHHWEQCSSREPQLIIEFPASLNVQSKNLLEERQAAFKKLLFEMTKKYYEKHLEELQNEEAKKDRLEAILQPKIFADPIKSQMWHHTFDPHSVPSIEQAPLKSLPQRYGRSESVKDFLDKSKLSTIMIDQSRPKLPHREMTLVRQQPISHVQESNLKKVSEKTGLSLDTLKIIQQNQDAARKAKESLTHLMKKEEGLKQEVELVKLAEQIRTVLTSKQKSTLSMKDMIQELNDNQRGQFKSRDNLMALIAQLTSLIPDWMTIKDIGTQGKFLKCSNTSLSNLGDLIRKRLAGKNQN